MAHLPEPIEEPLRRVVAPPVNRAAEPPLAPLDDLPPGDDPVVRQPKKLAELPEVPGYPRRAVTRIGVAAAGLGGGLGVLGLAVVIALGRWTPAARATRASERPSIDAGGPSTGNPSAGAAILLALGDPDGGADGAVIRTAVAPSPLAARTPQGWVASQQRLGRGRTLPQVLRALGLPSTASAKVISSMRPLVNMRALQPSDVIAVQRDPASENQVRRVEYRRGDSEVIAVTVAADASCTAERIRVVKSTVRVAAGLLVRGSLAASLEAAHLQADVVPLLQDVFRELDLGRELHEGDAVRLVVEEERLNDSFFRYGRIEAIEFRSSSGRVKRGYWLPTGPRGGAYFDAQGTAEVQGAMRPPINPPRITSPFNPRRMHPVLHRIMPHQGVDFGAPAGTPILAAADGVVVFRGWGGATGNLVRLSHPQLGLETGYAHMTRFEPSVTSGSRVRVGQVIGYVGSTGRSTGPHLHWSCKRNGAFIDGAPLLAWRRSVPAALRPAFDARMAQLNAELDAVPIATGPQGAPTSAPAATP
jgi:murein DD-endopeptidase MepM/ murein hydrolase activator NlpD